MAGTKAGGMKAAATNKAKYGKEFYARIGQKGGRLGHTGGLVKPMAVGVKLIFGKIRVEFDMVFWVILANRGGFLPSFGFDFETLNI